MRRNEKIFLVIAITLLCAPSMASKAYDPFTMIRSAPIATGYAAKMLCSGVFISGRQPESLWETDLELMHDNFVRGRVDYDNKSVDAYVFGFLFKRTAVYREGCGCTLLINTTRDELKERCDVDTLSPSAETGMLEWPMGDVASQDNFSAGIDRDQLDASLDWAFTEEDKKVPVRTRAVLVIYDGRIVAERYADGYSKDTPLLGWSMTKSVTSALIGILVRDRGMDIYQPAPIKEWQATRDPRKKITTDQLLRMSSGLVFREEYEENPDTDAGYMQFTIHDMADFAANKELESEPDTKFSYSSGTTILLARIIRETVGGSYQDYLSFPRRELFDKLGMTSAVIESDPSGTMVASAFMYATARDWARFGMLYYNDGVWSGERILPKGWVDYTREPSVTWEGYGAQFWLNRGGEDRWLPSCPEDIYSTWGHEGQFVTIVPSRKTIIVRLGQTFNESENWDHDYFVSNILKAMPE